MEEEQDDGSYHDPASDDDEESDDESFLLALSDLDYDSSAESDDDGGVIPGSNKGYNEPDNESYKATSTYTGVEVIRHSRFNILGDIKSRDRETKRRAKKKKQRKTKPSSSLSPSVPEKKDVLARAVRMARDLTASSESNVIDGHEDHPFYKRADAFSINDDEKTRRGWGRRGKRGDGGMYGTKYIGDFRPEIREYFEEGEREKSKKSTPGAMKEKLVQKYPERKYTTPGEIEIRGEIGKLIDEKKTQGGNGRLAQALPYYVTEFIEEELEKDPLAKPQAVFEKLVDEAKRLNAGSLPDSFPSGEEGKKRIKNKISTVKQKIKKTAMASVVDS